MRIFTKVLRRPVKSYVSEHKYFSLLHYMEELIIVLHAIMISTQILLDLCRYDRKNLPNVFSISWTFCLHMYGFLLCNIVSDH